MHTNYAREGGGAIQFFFMKTVAYVVNISRIAKNTNNNKFTLKIGVEKRVQTGLRIPPLADRGT